VEAIPLHVGFADITRKRDQFSYRGVAAMKTGVEASNLRDIRQSIEDGFNSCQTVRLM